MGALTIELASGRLLPPDVDLMVVPVFDCGGERDDVYLRIDTGLAGLPGRLAGAEGFCGRPETGLFMTPSAPGLAPRLLLAGEGPLADWTRAHRLAAAARAARAAATRRLASVGLLVRPCTADALHDAIAGLSLGAYAYDAWKTNDDARPTLRRAVLVLEDPAAIPDADRVRERALACSASVGLARDLVNEPAASLSPPRLVARARDVGAAAGLDVEVLGPSDLETLGAGLLLGVGAGSRDGPSVVRLSYRPSGSGAGRSPVALVGKGITFDTGGLDLKARGCIEDMKSDMAGAATVLAVMQALGPCGCPRPVDGWLAVCENAIGPGAMRPGDVLRSLAGRTVEVTDTDAEGRLVLADVLTLATRRGAGTLVDIATLTGACVIALGESVGGLFATDDRLADEIVSAGAWAGEGFWRLPLHDSVRPQLKSDIADLRNIGERWGGAIQGALFLAEFSGGRPFAHLDVAGPAWSRKDHAVGPRGGTGFGVRTLLQWLSQSG